MSEREISWGEDVEIEKEIPVVAAVVKKVEQSMAIPEWSIDTRGDLSIDKALGREEFSSASANSLSNNYQVIENTHVESSNPCWPEETEIVNSSSEWCNSQELPPTRRPGRDLMPRGDRNDRRKNYSGPNSSIINNGNSQSGGEGVRRNDRKFMDDISTLKLPGVDLSKMPSASTRLTFTNNRENNNNNNSGNDRRRGNEFGVSEEDRDRADVSERVERVTREIEELGWGEVEAVVEPIRSAPVHSEPIRNEPVRSEPVYSNSSRVESVRYEPSVIESVRDTVIRNSSMTQKDTNFEQKQQNYHNKNQAKVTNVVARLEDQGWGDEEEVVYCAPQSIEVEVYEPVKEAKVSSSVNVEGAKVSSSVNVEEDKVSSSVNVSAAAVISAENIVDNAVHKPSTSNETYPPIHAHHQIYQQMMMSPMSQHQMSHPYMMNPNPLSPVGQMPIAPMSVMPGMMMPIWVTCPFCYHCYMYPPVAPISPQQQQQVQNNN